jgi:hypothetical protein
LVLASVTGLAANSARADVIADLFNTGVDAAGVTLPDGTVDPHYVVVASPIGAGPALVVDPGGFPIPPWVANDPGPGGSMWISGPGYLPSDVPTGLYLYRTTFTILANQDPFSALISGEYTADDQASIYLNGIYISGPNPDEDYENFTPFSITSNFASGVNVLDFYVFDTHRVVQGLRVSMEGTVNSIPEPASFALLGLGGLGLLGFRHIRRRSRA